MVTSEGDSDVSSAQDWEAEVLAARHDLLTQRDHIIGTEAQVARLSSVNKELRAELARLRKNTKEVRGKLQEQRQITQRLRKRIETLEGELEAARARPSLARRVASRVRGTSR